MRLALTRSVADAEGAKIWMTTISSSLAARRTAAKLPRLPRWKGSGRSDGTDRGLTVRGYDKKSCDTRCAAVARGDRTCC